MQLQLQYIKDKRGQKIDLNRTHEVYIYDTFHKDDDNDSMKGRGPRGRMINTYERHINFFKEEKKKMTTTV